MFLLVLICYSKELIIFCTIGANMLFLPIAGWAAFGEPVIGRAYLSGIEEDMQFNPSVDFSVIFLLSVLLAFVGDVLLGIAIWRSRTLPKWAGAIWIAWRVVFYVAGVLVWSVLSREQQPTDTAHWLFADDDKRRLDSLERFPATFTCRATTT